MIRISFREQQKQIREDAILGALQSLLASQSYHDITMDDVARQVGISKATLYQHFESKEEMTVNLIIRCMKNSETLILQLDPKLPAVVRLQKAFEGILEGRFSNVPGLGVARSSLLAIRKNHAGFQVQYKKMVALLSQLVDAAKTEGDVATFLPTRVIIQVLFSCIRDEEYDELLQNKEITVPELAKTIVSILLNGMQNSKSTPAFGANI